MTKQRTDLLAVTEVAEILGVSVRTVHRMVARNTLQSVAKMGGATGMYLFQRKDVEAFAAKQVTA